MRALLISANTETINMPIIPVGLGAVLAATRRAGHQAELLDLLGASNTRLSIKEAVERLEPDVIGISIRNIDDQKMEHRNFLLSQVKPVISDCRSLSKAPIVLGGAGYSIFPESILKYLDADMGIQGEGEIAFPALLSLMEKGADVTRIAGLYMRGPGLQRKRSFAKNLDLLPVPSADLWPHFIAEDESFWMPIQTRRGCPFGCTYCSTPTIEGRIIRKRTPERVVDAIAHYVGKGFRRFFFTDNTFNIPSTYSMRLCRELAKRDLYMSWRCILYPGHVNSTLVKEMARAGCKEVSLGFESGCERILRAMNKRITLEQIRQASEMLADQGIRGMGFLLFGGPGETRESVQESLSFADSLQMHSMKVTIGVRIYPNTALAETALQEGVISADDDLLFPTFYVARGLKEWLKEVVSDFMAVRPGWVT